METQGIYKKKKPLIFRDFLVDLEGVSRTFL